MVIIVMIIGAICFYFQDSVIYPGISKVHMWKMLIIMLNWLYINNCINFYGYPWLVRNASTKWIGMVIIFLIDSKYIIRPFCKKSLKIALWVVVLISGIALIHCTVTSKNSNVIGGSALEPAQLRIGFTRMIYPFFLQAFCFAV